MRKYEVSLLSRDGREVHYFENDIPFSLFLERIPHFLAHKDVGELSIHISVNKEHS